MEHDDQPRVPLGLLQRGRRGRLARPDHPGGVRRRRPGRHRGGHRRAGDLRVRRRHGRLQRGPHRHLRVRADHPPRHRRPEAALPAAGRRPATCTSSFAVTEPDAGTDTTNISTFATKVDGGWSGHRQEGVDHQGAARPSGCCCSAGPRPREPRRQEDRRHDADVRARWTATTSRSDRSPRWAATPSTPTSCSSTTCSSPTRTSSARSAKGSRPSSPGSTPSGSSPRTPRSASAGPRCDAAPQYAKERVVFGRPIGQNQGIAFPLAEAQIRLDAADAVLKQGGLDGRPTACPAAREANYAKWLCAEAGFYAADVGAADARRVRLRQGVPRRALLPRGPAHADRADQPGDGAELRQRARARSARSYGAY